MSSSESSHGVNVGYDVNRKPAEHYNPILVEVLPHERRARHPYQVAVMMWMLTTAVSQLGFGLTPNSSLNLLPPDQVAWLNYWCLGASLAGLAAMFIPERIIRWQCRLRARCWRRVLRVDFDATWVRLIDEAASHMALIFAWASYFITTTAVAGFANGLGYGSGGALCLCIAAMWRFGQIAHTGAVPLLRRHQVHAVTGSETLGQSKGG